MATLYDCPLTRAKGIYRVLSFEELGFPILIIPKYTE